MSSSERHGQRLQALELANVVRSARAQLKREIAAGVVTVAEVLGDPPPEAEGCSLRELVACQRGWGRRRCTSFLAAYEIGERKLIRELTTCQRDLLAAELESLNR
ncbi:MAG: hypothetical protein WAL22_10825 [Solirubrobacteraceae bacterium]